MDEPQVSPWSDVSDMAYDFLAAAIMRCDEYERYPLSSEYLNTKYQLRVAKQWVQWIERTKDDRG